MAGLIFTLNENASCLRRVNALSKLFLLIVFSVLLSTGSPLMVAAIAILLLVIIITCRIPAIRMLLKNGFLLIIALLILVSSLLNKEGWAAASLATTRYLLIILLSVVFTSQTAPDETSRALGFFLSRLIGKAGWRTASAVELTLSLLPIIFNTSTLLLDARKSRGQSFLSHPVRAIGSYLTALITALTEKTEEYADALLSREYNTAAKRDAGILSYRDIMALLTGALFLGAHIYDKV
jgi:ABC-type cobalt transport system, permease component CbiQ and related transporters